MNATDEDFTRVRGGGWDLATLQRVVNKFVLHYDVEGTSYAFPWCLILDRLLPWSRRAVCWLLQFCDNVLDRSLCFLQTENIRSPTGSARSVSALHAGLSVCNSDSFEIVVVPDQ